MTLDRFTALREGHAGQAEQAIVSPTSSASQQAISADEQPGLLSLSLWTSARVAHAPEKSRDGGSMTKDQLGGSIQPKLPIEVFIPPGVRVVPHARVEPAPLKEDRLLSASEGVWSDLKNETAKGEVTMSMRRPLVFERERSALLTAIVENAFAEALKQGMLFKLHEQETRMVFVRRVIRAIEAGESDIDRLKALATAPMKVHNPARAIRLHTIAR